MGETLLGIKGNTAWNRGETGWGNTGWDGGETLVGMGKKAEPCDRKETTLTGYWEYTEKVIKGSAKNQNLWRHRTTHHPERGEVARTK